VLKETKRQHEHTRFAQAAENSSENKKEKKLKLAYFLSGIGIALLIASAAFYFHPVTEIAVVSVGGGIGLFALLAAWVI
jgi:hypothetical protein